jgi:hypothetical protein
MLLVLDGRTWGIQTPSPPDLPLISPAAAGWQALFVPNNCVRDGIRTDKAILVQLKLSMMGMASGHMVHGTWNPLMGVGVSKVKVNMLKTYHQCDSGSWHAGVGDRSEPIGVNTGSYAKCLSRSPGIMWHVCLGVTWSGEHQKWPCNDLLGHNK